MSLQPVRPLTEATARPGLSAPVRKSSAAPVFKPDFVRSVRMHPLVAAAVTALVFAVIFGYALMQKPVYEAEALVYVEPSASKVLDDGTGGLFDSNKYDSYLQQQMQTAERLDILKAAVHGLPVGVWRGVGESEQQAALRLQQGLKVERVLNSYQLSFTLKGPTAQGTADTLNAAIAAFLAAGRQDELSTAGERAQILSEEKDRISAELTAARTEQATLSSSLGMANPGLDADNPYDAQLAGLRTQLSDARQAHDVAAAQLASVSGTDTARTQGLTAAADELIAGDAGLSSMKATISQRRAVLSGQMAGLTPENPIYKQDQVEIADLDRTLDTMTTQMRDKAERRLQDKLRTDLARTGDVEARLNAQLASQTYAATSASPKLQRAAELTADIQRLMKRYATVDDSLRSVQLETSGPGMAHLALAAAAPVYPVPSRRKLMLLAALPLALLCGAFAAVFFRKRDPHVYTGRDFEDLLGFTPIAVLPSPEDVSDGVMQEYVLRLAGGIESAFRTAGARSFVLTPTGTKIAVETLSTPLAMRLSQLGLVVSTTTARQMMAGPTAKAAIETEAFHGSVVEARLDELKRQNDLVFIYAPALLTSAETEYLVRCADATILVASSGITRRGDLLQAALLLERLGVKGVGAVLEGLQLRFADAAYRHAVADLDRRQGFEDRVARALEPVADEGQQASVKRATMQHVEAGRREEMEPVAAQIAVEPGPAEDQRVEPKSDENTQIPAAALALDEMMEPLTQEPAPAVVPEIETPTFPAQATEEPLPMAMQFLKFEQPDEPVAVQHVGAQPPPMQTGTVQSVHRRVPVRRVQAEPEAVPRSWFQRLFQRDAEPVVSIIPDNNDEEEDVAADVSEPSVAAPAVFAAEDLDILPVAAMVGSPAKEDAAVTAVAEPEMVASGIPLARAEAAASVSNADAERPVAPVAWQQHPVEVPEQASVILPAPMVMETVSAWQVVEAPAESVKTIVDAAPSAEPVMVEVAAPMVLEPVAEVAMPEPAAVEAVRSEPTAAEPVEIEYALPVLLEAEPEQGAEPRAAAVEMMEQPVTQSLVQLEPADATPEPYRTGRWEPARQTSRPEATPWRDRRVSGPNEVYGAPERRFNWNTAAAKPISLVPNPVVEPVASAPRLPERNAPLPPAPTPPARLSRQWGLLSRFEDPQAAGDGGREQERRGDRSENEGAGKRGYRRG